MDRQRMALHSPVSGLTGRQMPSMQLAISGIDFLTRQILKHYAVSRRPFSFALIKYHQANSPPYFGPAILLGWFFLVARRYFHLLTLNLGFPFCCHLTHRFR